MMNIRQYQPDDYASVIKLHAEGVAQIEAEFAAATGRTDNDDEDPPFADADLEDIPSHYINAGGDFIVGELNGQIVAIGGLQRQTGTRALVRRMRTRSDLQSTGCGRMILERLLARAVELGYEEVIVDPLVTNTGARRFYERAGFTESGREKVGRYTIVYYALELSRR